MSQAHCQMRRRWLTVCVRCPAFKAMTSSCSLKRGLEALDCQGMRSQTPKTKRQMTKVKERKRSRRLSSKLRERTPKVTIPTAAPIQEVRVDVHRRARPIKRPSKAEAICSRRFEERAQRAEAMVSAMMRN